MDWNWIGEELTLTGNRNHRCFKIVLPFWGVGNIQRSGDIVTQGDRCWKSGRMNISPAALSPILCFTVLLMLLITARLRTVSLKWIKSFWIFALWEYAIYVDSA